jgi:hypothetical protein
MRMLSLGNGGGGSGSVTNRLAAVAMLQKDWTRATMRVGKGWSGADIAFALNNGAKFIAIEVAQCLGWLSNIELVALARFESLRVPLLAMALGRHCIPLLEVLQAPTPEELGRTSLRPGGREWLEALARAQPDWSHVRFGDGTPAMVQSANAAWTVPDLVFALQRGAKFASCDIVASGSRVGDAELCQLSSFATMRTPLILLGLERQSVAILGSLGTLSREEVALAPLRCSTMAYLEALAGLQPDWSLRRVSPREWPCDGRSFALAHGAVEQIQSTAGRSRPARASVVAVALQSAQRGSW